MNGGRTGRRLGALLMIGALAGPVALSSCTQDDAPPGASITTPASTGSASPAASPTATPAAPTAPKAEPTPKSAEAFVKYFWEIHNYAYATLDLEAFKSIAEPGCTFCASTIDDLETMRRAGTRTEGSFIRMVVAAAPPTKIRTGIIVGAVISQDPGRAIRSNGTVRIVPAMAKTQSYVSLNWTGRKWLVEDVALNKSAKNP